jgi:ubiquinone/menaquinone biosynthesis C-methylase UbiE
MFDIITKCEYWRWCDEGLVPHGGIRRLEGGESCARTGPAEGILRALSKGLRAIPSLRGRLPWIGHPRVPVPPYELKDVQDAYILSRLRGAEGNTILEVGGGCSRVLPRLAKNNECWLVDKYEGGGNGPLQPLADEGIRVVRGYMGEFDRVIPDGYFDFLFSISVVEHIPWDRLEDFFRDCARVLKPGGFMFHAIDTYLFDTGDAPSAEARMCAEQRALYLGFQNRPDLKLAMVIPPALGPQCGFSCRYASNPDNILHAWNRSFGYAQRRELAQEVSIKAEWAKTPPLQSPRPETTPEASPGTPQSRKEAGHNGR